ncbi:MAG: ATP-binding protein [Candidatus Methanomethylophilaceae archaeon]|nr:ATP-binding protein [Candidatus Methanomethylophilaceae archaeon]
MDQRIVRKRPMEMLRSGRGLMDVVKVVTGMRRCGKSTLMEMYADELIASGVPYEDIVSINLESKEYMDLETSEQLSDAVFSRIGNSGIKYVFIDEIQNVIGWERAISALTVTRRCDIHITGSNSHMLSSELATHISGRYVEIELTPLSFREYMELHPGDRRQRFNEYLRFGALPEVDLARGAEFCDAQLIGIYNTVLVKDILRRLERGDARTLDSIARFLYSNVGNLTNIDSIANTLNIGNSKVSRYVSMLCEAFLFYDAERYDIVRKKVLKTNGKFYASDLGIRNVALRGSGMADISRPLENLVFLELVRRGYTVRIGSFRDREVDFTASKDGRTEYYQVCQTMLSEDTRERELYSLEAIRDNHPKIVLTLDDYGLGSDEGIEIMNVIDWFMSSES